MLYLLLTLIPMLLLVLAMLSVAWSLLELDRRPVGTLALTPPVVSTHTMRNQHAYGEKR